MCSKSQVPPMRNPILFRTATDVSEEIRQGKLKSVDVLNAYFERIEEVNPLIHAVTDRDKENAFQQANYIDNLVEEGSALTLNMPLLGVPISVKDTIDVKGMRATRGLVSRRNVFATQDSKVVENIRKSGGIPIVATNIPELLSWFDSSNKAFGKTKNPYNFSRVPGGSSGGEGALIAAGGSLIGLGTDVGGSLRIPASFCGIFSHKISPGLTPLAGVYPEIKSDFNFLLTVGPMCRYADDLIPTIKALTETKAGMLSDLNQPIDLKALKYHYLLDVPAPQKTKLAKDVKMKFMETVRILEESLDIKFTEVNPKTFSESHELWVKIYVRSTVIAFRDALSDGKDHLNLCLEMFKSIGGCSKHTFKSLLVAALVDAELKKDIPTSTLIEERNKLLAAFENLIGPNDILLCPTHPEVAPKHWSTVFKSTDIANATLFNILGVPVTNCPIGFNNKGLPIGVQIASRQYNDRLTIALAKKLDEILGGWKASWVSV